MDFKLLVLALAAIVLVESAHIQGQKKRIGQMFDRLLKKSHPDPVLYQEPQLCCISIDSSLCIPPNEDGLCTGSAQTIQRQVSERNNENQLQKLLARLKELLQQHKEHGKK